MSDIAKVSFALLARSVVSDLCDLGKRLSIIAQISKDVDGVNTEDVITCAKQVTGALIPLFECLPEMHTTEQARTELYNAVQNLMDGIDAIATQED